MIPALRRHAPDLLAAAVAAAVTGWRADVPSPWRDEGATWLAAGRPLPDLFALTRTVDLVHLPYYLVGHVVLMVQDSILALRWMSVAAVAATAAILAALGRRLGSAPVGVTAGLLVAVSPMASRYAQDARPYALAALAATTAAYALVTAADPDARRSVWAGYAASVVATGLANVLALLVLAGHAVHVLGYRRAARRRWLVSSAAAIAVLAPFLLATSEQRGQVGWLARPSARDLRDVLAAPYGGWLLPGVLLALAGVAAVVRPAWVHRPALVLGAAWGLLPPLALWLISQWVPLFDGRYVVAALPGVALALAAPAAALTSRRLRVVIPVTLAGALAVSGWPAHLRYRDPASGHGEDVRGVVRLLTEQAVPGDAVLFVPYHLRIVALMAPDLTPEELAPDARPLPDDVALGQDALASVTLSGNDVDPAALPARLAGRARVWLVTGPRELDGTATATDEAKAALLRGSYREAQRWEVTRFVVVLYARPGPAGLVTPTGGVPDGPDGPG